MPCVQRRLLAAISRVFWPLHSGELTTLRCKPELVSPPRRSPCALSSASTARPIATRSLGVKDFKRRALLHNRSGVSVRAATFKAGFFSRYVVRAPGNFVTVVTKFARQISTLAAPVAEFSLNGQKQRRPASESEPSLRKRLAPSAFPRA